MALAERGAVVGLWASDQSAAAAALLSPSPVQCITGNEAEALDRFGDIDILHDNGIWLPHNHHFAVLAERRGIPRVVSTRGMLEPWALRHKWLRKRLAWWLYQRRDLKHARCHHATAEPEARNVQHLGFGVPVVAIPNGVDVPENWVVSSKCGRAARHGRTALFLGRIYPIKGLAMLVEAWARVRPDGWRLRISGPDEAGHQKQVEKVISATGLGEAISFTGPIGPRMKTSAFFEADLFVLPSHSESFGIVVAEALAHGLPVLTTKGTPWSILPDSGCGWWVDATVDGIAEGLRQATVLDTETLQAMGTKGRALVIAEFGWKRVAELMLSTYEAILANVMV